MAETASRLADLQPLLDFPDAGGYRVHDGYLQILLQYLENGERAPAGAEHVDCIRAPGLEEISLDVSIDLLARKLLDLVEGHIDAGHPAHFETGILEKFREDAVELVGEIGRPDEALRIERPQRADVILRHAHDRRFEL